MCVFDFYLMSSNFRDICMGLTGISVFYAAMADHNICTGFGKYVFGEFTDCGVITGLIFIVFVAHVRV